MLEKIFAEKQIKRDAEDLAHWGKDWTNGFAVAPSAVVFPESNEQVVELVTYAGREGVALVPSGGRTGLSGGAIASNGEVVVSFDKMNRILDYKSPRPIGDLPSRGCYPVFTGFRRRERLFLPC